VTKKVLNFNLLRYWPGNKIKIPINFINADQNETLKRECFVLKTQYGIDCLCGEEIPKELTLDLANAKKGDVFRLNSLVVPPKVRPAPTVAPDLVLCVVKTLESL
jgi:hypothetical protein